MNTYVVQQTPSGMWRTDPVKEGQTWFFHRLKPALGQVSKYRAADDPSGGAPHQTEIRYGSEGVKECCVWLKKDATNVS